MNRSGRTRTCTLADARMRLGSASEFLAAADVLAAGPVSFSNDVLAANAIDAAIAAADAICCVRRQERSASGSHADAAELLRKIDRKLGDELARVLGVKNTAAYDTKSVTDEEAKMCRRVAGRLVEAARQAVQQAKG